MGMVMIFLRMRGPGAHDAYQEPAAQSSASNPILPQEKVNLAAAIDSGSPTARKRRAGRLRGDSTGIPARAGPSAPTARS
mgnify:CR=1 FL=1